MRTVRFFVSSLMSCASSSSKPPRSEEKDRGRLRSLFSFSSMFEMISSNKKYSSFYVLPSFLSSSLSLIVMCALMWSPTKQKKKERDEKKISFLFCFVRAWIIPTTLDLHILGGADINTHTHTHTHTHTSKSKRKDERHADVPFFLLDGLRHFHSI